MLNNKKDYGSFLKGGWEVEISVEIAFNEKIKNFK